ncbi:hypothetical protein FrEUN1fDRAFT_7405 [Parafrankia sp. EUN1f]|nr:hypothetical protein FrEUN1fDRAFT_7405 [Parafrankia sp. EUN1f]
MAAAATPTELLHAKSYFTPDPPNIGFTAIGWPAREYLPSSSADLRSFLRRHPPAFPQIRPLAGLVAVPATGS